MILPTRFYNKLTKKTKEIECNIPGGYLALDKNHVKKFAIDKNVNKGHAEFTVSSLQYKYLEKMINLCRIYNIRLILINTPLYKADIYTDNVSFDLFRQKELSEIEYLDFSMFSLPESCYADLIHLNKYGAAIFSEYLNCHDVFVK